MRVPLSEFAATPQGDGTALLPTTTSSFACRVAVEAAQKAGKAQLLHDQLVELANAHNKSQAGTFIPAAFLRVTVTV